MPGSKATKSPYRASLEGVAEAQTGAHELSLDRVTVTFGKLRALNEVSVSVRSGEALMLVGPNGSGKSTLIRVLLGLVRPDAGTLSMDGTPIRVDRTFKEGLGYLPEAIAFSENLTGAQVLRFFARARAVDKGRAAAVLERVGLTEASKRRVRGYSRGMRQRLGLAIAILSEPTLLVLDEPTGGLDVEGLDVLFDVLAEWRSKGRMVLVASHDLTLLEKRVDRICVLRSGERVVMDSPGALREAAGLPIRVTFTTHGDSSGLQDALAGAGIGEVSTSADRIVIQVPPGELMALMDLRSEHGEGVVGVRVEEPGMDAIYEHLLRANKEGET